MPNVIWKTWPRDSRYEVSSDGQVRSWAGIRGIGRRKVPLTLSQHRTKQTGYMTVHVAGGSRLVHRMLLEAFIGSPDTPLDACHGNGIRDDNRIENLRWDTRKGNFQDRERHGNTARGARHGMTSLTEENVQYIHASPKSTRVLARELGVSRQTIGNIRNGKTWARSKPKEAL